MLAYLFWIKLSISKDFSSSSGKRNLEVSDKKKYLIYYKEIVNFHDILYFT